MSREYSFIVTGASKGLGAALAFEAYSKGFSLDLIARNSEELTQVKENIHHKLGWAPNQTISLHTLDLTDLGSVEKTVKNIFLSTRSIKCLVNNAGTWTGGNKLLNLYGTDIQRSLDLNFFSAFNITQTLLRCEKKPQFSIINIGATSSLQGWKNTSSFCIAKGALRTYSQSLAREWGPKGVHVAHLIIDGLINNERTRKLNPNLPAERFMNPDEIAKDIIRVALQEPSCWTFEWDLRPYNEDW